MDKNGVELTSNNQVAVLTVLPEQFDISFEVKPLKFTKGWHSVIHMTTGASCCGVGTRIPGVWFEPDTDGTTARLMTSMAINGNGNTWKLHTIKRPLGEWIMVRITQSKEAEKTWFRVYENNELQFEYVNNNPRSFSNVKVYTADQWSPPQDGRIRNLRISNSKSFFSAFKFILKMKYSVIHSRKFN